MKKDKHIPDGSDNDNQQPPDYSTENVEEYFDPAPYNTTGFKNKLFFFFITCAFTVLRSMKQPDARFALEKIYAETDKTVDEFVKGV